MLGDNAVLSGADSAYLCLSQHMCAAVQPLWQNPAPFQATFMVASNKQQSYSSLGKCIFPVKRGRKGSL